MLQNARPASHSIIAPTRYQGNRHVLAGIIDMVCKDGLLNSVVSELNLYTLIKSNGK